MFGALQGQWLQLQLFSNIKMYYLPPDTADRIRISRLPGATFDNVQDWLNNIQSSGRISGGEITDNGDGSVTVAAGTGFIKIGDSEIALTQSFDWAEDNNVALTDNNANYIYIDYNAASPQILVTTDRTSIRATDQFPIGRVYRAGITLHIINTGIRLYNQVRQEHERLLTVRGFERASGGIVSETGLRFLVSTAGVFYLGHNRLITPGQDTSAADRFTAYYYDGAAWVPVPAQTQISNTQYNDITLGLANLTANRYGVHWIYIDYDGHLFSIYGQGNYKLAAAENAVLPNSIPLILRTFAILVAKIIIKRNAANFTSCVTAYKTLFPVSTPPEHNDLGGMQGGVVDEYYHLTNTQHTNNVIKTGNLIANRMVKANAASVVENAAMTEAQVAAAIAAAHARQHAITQPLDHTSGATPGQVLQGDANGLPVDATNTDAEVAAAVALAHARDHAARHQNGGADEVNIAGLDGESVELAAHKAVEAAGIHGSTVAANVNKLIHRDAAGRAKIVDPAVAADIDNLGARDAAIAAIVLDDLFNVVDTAALEGDMLYFDQLSGTWMVGARPNLAELLANLTILHDLADVNIPAPADLDFIYWDDVAGKWVNISYANLLASIQGDTSLDELADVEVPAPADDDFFYYDDATGLWKSKAHADLTTGVHGLGAYGFTPSTLAAVTLYVDNAAGNDGNPGTSGSPKKTIKGALDALPIGIAHTCTICVRGPQNYPENNIALEFSRFSTLANITIKTVNSSDEDMYDNGQADAGAGNDELDDATKSWSVDQFKGAYVWIHHGTGEGQIREIDSNTATKLTLTANWAVNPDGTSYYAIGGGATMTGTDSYHTRISSKLVNIYGFKHTGATLYDIRIDQGGILNAGYNYCATSVRGIGASWLGIIAGPDPQYNYIAATTSGIDMMGLAYGVIRGNVITGAAKGIRLYYGSIAAGSGVAYRQNHIMNCTIGISIESGSGMTGASFQSFGAGADANGADIDPAVSTVIPRWYT